MKAETRKPKFLPGTTYKTRGRHPLLCTVTNVLTTYNMAGELVKYRYEATHSFLGQTVTDCDVCETTIAIGLVEAVSPVTESDTKFSSLATEDQQTYSLPDKIKCALDDAIESLSWFVANHPSQEKDMHRLSKARAALSICNPVKC